MSSGGARKAWAVAASIGAVEALKDQLGLCRWNYPLRSLHQKAKSNLTSYYLRPNTRLSSSNSTSILGKMKEEDKVKRTEETLKNVMNLSCWGPNTVRF
ncbi:hypothetical protein LguiA_023183 [Lonicera macranthoides]